MPATSSRRAARERFRHSNATPAIRSTRAMLSGSASWVRIFEKRKSVMRSRRAGNRSRLVGLHAVLRLRERLARRRAGELADAILRRVELAPDDHVQAAM